MKDALIAFDDSELSNWLMDLIEVQPRKFLGALAEAVVAADAEDYRLIRPALVTLKHKYCSADKESPVYSQLNRPKTRSGLKPRQEGIKCNERSPWGEFARS